MTDPIADMLSRIRNGYLARQAQVAIPFSKIKLEVGKILAKRGLIGEVKYKPGDHDILVDLKYIDGQPALEHVRRISRPGLRVYQRSQKIRRIRSGLGLVLISTSQGIMTGDEARHKKLGGEVLAEAW